VVTASSTTHLGDEALERAWSAVRSVPDPEIPVLTVVDLGVVRTLDVDADGGVRIGITPTYSGCPATHVIRGSLVQALRDAGFARIDAFDVLSPPWSSEWITADGRDKLRAYGIAPPVVPVTSGRALMHGEPAIACPQCGSTASERISEFGSTPCKALYRCTACLEPFDYFKCI
jgi:ring-1,2-phenylacetyl-CoA epoxidase subunit PaaD